MTITPSRLVSSSPAVVMRHAVSPVARIVVGVDGSAGSTAALSWAVTEACRRQVLLRIVSAWQDPDQRDAAGTGSAARIAAAHVQKALAYVLLQQNYPRRIACATAKGVPGAVLLNEVSDAGLLVLGATGNAAAQAPGKTGQYCLRRGSGPLVFVPSVPRCDDPRSSPTSLAAGSPTARSRPGTAAVPTLAGMPTADHFGAFSRDRTDGETEATNVYESPPISAMSASAGRIEGVAPSYIALRSVCW
jgi:nucleotide-binding universal stress UspA family protein